MAPVLSGMSPQRSLPQTREAVSCDPSEAALGELSTDAIFDILNARRRREVLHYLHTHDGAVTLGRLAEHVAAAENGIEREALTSSQRKQVYVALHQCHLPRMVDYGVLEYDRSHIRLCDPAHSVLPYLYFSPDEHAFGSVETGGLVAPLWRYICRVVDRCRETIAI